MKSRRVLPSTQSGTAGLRPAATTALLGGAVALIGGLAGCMTGEPVSTGQPPAPHEDNLVVGSEGESATTGQPLTLGEQNLVVESEGECADKCVRVDLTWPVVQSAPDAAVARNVERTLRQWYLGPLYRGQSAETPEALAQQLIDKYSDGKLRWSFTRSWQTEFRSVQLWTLKRIDEAHNFSSRPYIEWERIHLDAVTGERIDLSSYFDETAMDRLNARAEARFREQYHADYAEYHGAQARDFYEVWRFENNRFAVPEDFFVNTDGIVFHWNQYEIGPGSAGSQTIRLTWDEVADLLRDNAPVPRIGTTG